MWRNTLLAILLFGGSTVALNATAIITDDNVPENLDDYTGKTIDVIIKTSDDFDPHRLPIKHAKPLFDIPSSRTDRKRFNDIGLQRYFRITVTKDLGIIRETINQLQHSSMVQHAYLEPVANSTPKCTTRFIKLLFVIHRILQQAV